MASTSADALHASGHPTPVSFFEIGFVSQNKGDPAPFGAASLVSKGFPHVLRNEPNSGQPP
jgi:hypothetical protein